MSTEIRPDNLAGVPYAPEVPLATRMPNTCSLPGQGDNADSVRTLKVAVDLFDTVSRGDGADTEIGNMTVDRIEVRAFPLIAD